VSHPLFFVAPSKQAATNMSEASIQSKAFQNLWNSRPDLRGRIFAINNNSVGGARGAMNKAMGVVAGVADMCYLKPEGQTCFIEWKTETGKQSPEQVKFQQLCLSLGHEYHIVRSEAEFLAVILHNQIK
jgi:hypothetical protein